MTSHVWMPSHATIWLVPILRVSPWLDGSELWYKWVYLSFIFIFISAFAFVDFCQLFWLKIQTYFSQFQTLMNVRSMSEWRNLQGRRSSDVLLSMYTTVQKFGVRKNENVYSAKWQFTFYNVTKHLFLHKCCSFELSIHQTFPQNINIYNIWNTPNQHIRIIRVTLE